jgi:hypothetical protein
MMYRVIPAMAAIALLSACQAGGTKDQTTSDKDKGAATADATVGAPQAEAKDAAPSASAPSDKGAAPDLSAYVGKYPFDKVSGVSWLEHPVVKAAVTKTVTDPAALKTILASNGPADVIKKNGTRLQSWACQQHDCGPLNWTVQIDPANGTADVCYFDEKVSDKSARWFLSNGTEEKRDGDCPAE